MEFGFLIDVILFFIFVIFGFVVYFIYFWLKELFKIYKVVLKWFRGFILCKIFGLNEFYVIKDRFLLVKEVLSVIKKVGLELSNFIIGIDFMVSNEW